MTHPEQQAFPKNESSSEGLTKKEYASIMAMQGFLSSGWTGDKKEMVSESIAFANELMKQLSEE